MPVGELRFGRYQGIWRLLIAASERVALFVQKQRLLTSSLTAATWLLRLETAGRGLKEGKRDVPLGNYTAAIDNNRLEHFARKRPASCAGVLFLSGLLMFQFISLISIPF